MAQEKKPIPKDAIEAVKQALDLLREHADVLPGQIKMVIGVLTKLLAYGEKKESIAASEVHEALFLLENLVEEERALPARLVQALKSLIKILANFLAKYGYYPYYRAYPYKYYKAYPKPEGKGKRVRESELLEKACILSAAEADVEGLRWTTRLIEGGLSKNRCYYPIQVLREAVHLFEGVKFFVDHPTKHEARERPERSLMDFAGWFEEPRIEGNDLIATLNVLASHPIHQKLLELEARNALSQIGLSIRGKGETRLLRQDGRIVEEVLRISKIHSVDAVTEPAAGGRFLEIQEEVGFDMIDTLSLEELRELRPDLVDALRTELQSESEPQVVELDISQESEAPDKAKEEIKGLFEEVKRERCTLLLERKLAESALPEPLKAKIKRIFGDRIFEEDELMKVIEDERETYAKVIETMQPKARIISVVDERDKFAKALEGMIAGKEIDGITPFRSLFQAYCYYKGIQDPWSVSRSALAAQILQESARYDSGLKESIETSDWAQVFGDSITRRMIKEYRLPLYDDWRKIVSDIRPLKDLRVQRIVRIGYYGLLPTVPEGGTYQPLTSPSDEEVTYSPAKKGGLEDYTWEALVNDDLGALQRIPRKLALAAKITLYKFVFDFLADNPTIYDGVALFHANHGNLGTTALSSDSLTTAKVAMMGQTALDSTYTYLIVEPRYLVVPRQLQATALQLRNSEVEVTAGKDATVANPHFETFDVITVPYFTDANNWYLVANPELIPTIEVGFLDGRDEPELFTEVAHTGSHFTADVLRFKIRFVFGGAVQDYRAFYGGLPT